jgi:hypothetical protein
VETVRTKKIGYVNARVGVPCICAPIATEPSPTTWHDGVVRLVSDTDRGSVTHYVDEDWGPLCKEGRKGDMMWAFCDEQITCPACLDLLNAGADE